MGWSCAAAAGRTMEAMAAFAKFKNWDGSNSVNQSAFFEGDGVEHDDGAITGLVVPLRAGGDAGRARIEPDGRISKMPGFDLKGFVAWAGKQPRWQPAAHVQQLAKAPVRPMKLG